MKPLIKPLLLIFIRTGLFLCLAGWAWTQTHRIAFRTGQLDSNATQHGYIFNWPDSWREENRLIVEANRSTSATTKAIDLRAFGIKDDAMGEWLIGNSKHHSTEFSLLGVNITSTNDFQLTHVAVRHWTLILIFITANVSTSLLFRKKKRQPHDG